MSSIDLEPVGTQSNGIPSVNGSRIRCTICPAGSSPRLRWILRAPTTSVSSASVRRLPSIPSLAAAGLCQPRVTSKTRPSPMQVPMGALWGVGVVTDKYPLQQRTTFCCRPPNYSAHNTTPSKAAEGGGCQVAHKRRAGARAFGKKGDQCLCANADRRAR